MAYIKPSIYDTTTFNLKIKGLSKLPPRTGTNNSEGAVPNPNGLSDVVYKVFWFLTGTEGTDIETKSGSTFLDTTGLTSENMVEFSKLTNDIVEKSKVKIKEDDVETGPEKLENKTPDLKVKEETVIENNTPNNNKNNTQMAVKNQKDSIKKSEQVVTDLEAEARKQGKMTVLNDALEAARGVMGERGYNK